MISQLATDDLNDLRAQGLSPSDDDIIRLHALAARITDGPETSAANAPRWAIAGGVVFYEPTLAARYWFEFAKTFAADADTADWLFAFACANGRRVGYLENLRDRDAINVALGKFLASVAAAPSEVWRAIVYATTGYGSPEPEKTDLAKKHDADKASAVSDDDGLSDLEAILRDAAAATGLTLDDIMGQTVSRLVGMIYAANVRAGMSYSRTSAKAHAEYLATFAAIEKRLRDEKATPPSPVPADSSSPSPVPADSSAGQNQQSKP